MNQHSEDDLRFCWDQVLQQDPWFRLHYVFAPKQTANAILGVHALFAMIERTLSVSDETIVLAQLAWWHAELTRDRAGVSAHPVVRSLRNSCGLDGLLEEISELFISQALFRHQAEPVKDQAELKALCDRIGMAKIQAELALLPDEKIGASLRGRCAGTGLSCIVDAALKCTPSRFWFMPLDLRAKFQIDMSAADQTGHDHTAPVSFLMDLGNAWFNEQIGALASEESYSTDSQRIRRHLMALVKTQQLRFSRTMSELAKGGGVSSTRWGLSDFIRVWAACRSVSSQPERLND